MSSPSKYFSGSVILSQRRRISVFGAATIACALLAKAELPTLLQHATANSAIESALFRLMDLPGLKALYPRPPREAQTELQKLLAQDAKTAELYSLKAMEDEQSLDFAAAESDWKAYAAHAQDHVAANLQLADYYHRRLQAPDEVSILMQVGAAPTPASETYTQAPDQRSWKAYDRLLTVADDQALDRAVTQRAYDAWLARYAAEPAIYARYFSWLLETQQYDAASSLIDRYRKAFPTDFIFPVKATALRELRRGNTQNSLAVYDAAFQPLWPQELLDSYFSLLAQLHQERTFLGDAKARLAKDPDDINALARIYFYQRHATRNDAAQAAVDSYRLSKETRKAAWSAQELYVLLTLMQSAQAWPEATRYAFALYNLPGNATLNNQPAQSVGLAALIEALLTAPDQPIALGAHNLSMYRDIATMDQGPGYWNGILSLWLNSASPESEYHSEETKAQPYFHRAKAAELLQTLDTRWPQSTSRATLHARLISVYAEYGDDTALLKEGTLYLQQFPTGTDRIPVALQMADAYARANNTTAEFALYDHLLTELSAQTQGMPLTAASASQPPTAPAVQTTDAEPSLTTQPAAITIAPTPVHIAGAAEYQQILERYLSRLVAAKQMQPALAVLRKELDRNPNDPLLYERLAQFLDQNNLGAQQEEVYKAAMARFADKGWYNKLARLYLRQKRASAFADLTKQVTDTFEGTDLEAYFTNTNGVGAQMFLELNVYAAKRFPHDLTFTRNLLSAYQRKETRNDAARVALLRAHWWEADDLRTQFFEQLSRTNTLDAELAQLRALTSNPATNRELAEAEIWRSHFEDSAAPLDALTALYPADATLGDQASSIFRSLAYYDPTQTNKAIAIQNHLLAADPGNLDRLVTLGDTFADSGAIGVPGHEDLAAAEPYWHRMPTLKPGNKDGYLQAATVFWDYFEFDKALDQIAAARTHFADPTLFGYEAGAVCEGKRDNPCALREYTAAALTGDTESHARLLTLSRREGNAPLILAQLATNHTASAIALREDLLEAQNRTAEIQPLLADELSHATTLDAAASIATRAQSHNFTHLYEQALEKQIALALDPVQKTELQYTLAQSHESRADIPGANRIITAIYTANPRILGVIRATVDFDWRNHLYPQAITVLRDSASAGATAARPDLARTLTLEAISKATESANYTLARDLLKPYLDAAPFDPQLLALTADTFSRANDTAALRDFYTARLALIKTSTLSADDKKRTTLLLRRGLIPALTSLHDYPAATDQYIAMLSAYPEDTGLTNEAALYAMRWQQKDRLLNFVTTTVQQSSKDSRFAAMLAQLQTTYENFPAAIDAWSRAIAIRADKADWYSARADLNLRLNHLDEACADYDRLYVLTYKNPDWMLQIATIRAQQGRKQATIDALQKAWIVGHAATAADNFRIADQLESWAMLDEGRTFAEQGLKLSGDDLLVDQPDGAATYARIMARLRQSSTAVDVLTKSLAAAKLSPLSPSVVAVQIAKSGLASVTDSEWRKKFAQQRSDTAQANYKLSLNALATTVNTFYTPEEKIQFATFLTQHDLRSLAGAAGLKDIQSQWLLDTSAGKTPEADAQFAAFVALQRSRGLHASAAGAEELRAATRTGDTRLAYLLQAAADARDSGNLGSDTEELRILSAIPNAQKPPALLQRYFALLLQHNQPKLFTLAATNNTLGDAATNYTLAHAEEPLALRALTARGSTMQPVWNSTYRAVTGLYFNDTSPATDSAFRTILSDSAIAERLAHPTDTTRALTDDQWFSYAGRYAIFRFNGGPGDAEDFAAAELEHNASFQNYVNLAKVYAEANKLDPALIEYRHALELQPEAATLQDAMAVLLWRAGRHEEALREWHNSLTTLTADIQLQAVPEDFFVALTLLLHHAHTTGAMPQLHSSFDPLLRAYLAKNGTYRSNELLRAAFENSATPAEGAAWIVALSSASKDQPQTLADLDSVSWLPKTSQEAIKLKELELARAAELSAPADTSHASRVETLELSLLRFYVDQKNDAKANAILAALPTSRQTEYVVIVARIRLAARAGTLPALLASFDALPEATQPSVSYLKAAAAVLHTEKDFASTRLVLESVFVRQQLLNELNSTDLLALAEARLNTDDTPGALDLLRRLTLLPSSKDRFANYDLAATLLETSGHPKEAIDFLQPLAAGMPWETVNTIRLDEARLKSNTQVDDARSSLTAIASSTTVTHDLRARAAGNLESTSNQQLGSKELTLLASPAVTFEQCDNRYFVKAILKVAAQKPLPTLLEFNMHRILAVAPDTADTPAIRILLFRASAKLGKDRPALTAITPLLSLLEQKVFDTTPQPASIDTDDVADQKETSTSEVTTEPKHTIPSLNTADRAQLLSEIADVTWHLAEDSTSQRYLRQAISLTTDDKQKAAWRKLLATRQSSLRREQINDTRRPIIQTEWQANVTTKPRLLATKGKP